MDIHVDKMGENKSQSVAHDVSKKKDGGVFIFRFVDLRHEALNREICMEWQIIASNLKRQFNFT